MDATVPTSPDARTLRGEVVHFDIAPAVKLDKHDTVGIIELSVCYSLNRTGDVIQRSVDYHHDD